MLDHVGIPASDFASNAVEQQAGLEAGFTGQLAGISQANPATAGTPTGKTKDLHRTSN